MTAPKLQFSSEEIELVQNQQWLLTKNTIIGKIYLLMGSLSERLRKDFEGAATDLTEAAPKISRGENYKGLPYVMLDYPRLFKKDSVCAIRSFFWWGHYFSITLHLKGEWALKLGDPIAEVLPALIKNDFRLSVDGDEWEHDLSAAHYKPLADLDASALQIAVKTSAYVKLSSKISLDNWELIEENIYSKQKLLSALLTHQFPNR